MGVGTFWPKMLISYAYLKRLIWKVFEQMDFHTIAMQTGFFDFEHMFNNYSSVN